MLTKEPSALEPPYALSIARGSGLSESWITDDPAPPGAKTRINAANTSKAIIPAMRPLGMSVAGSRVSSAASGTPSMARKNQIPYGNAPQRPTRPNGRDELAPAAFDGSISNRL